MSGVYTGKSDEEGTPALIGTRPSGGAMGGSLAQLSLGATARIASIGGDQSFRRRLLELGVMPGIDVRVVRSAPFGDPIEITVRGYNLSLRRSEAATISVEGTDSARPEPLLTGELAALAPVRPTSHPERPRRPTPVPLRVPGYRVAVAGNPNTGKTTLFNALTGANAQVGNYPGITVDRRVGRARLPGDLQVELVDIPGAYSLCSRSREEQLALDEMLGRVGGAAPDALIVVLNATALARSLYLLLQVQEFGLPVLGVVNMTDEARNRGLEIDIEQLERHFGLPFVAVSARSKEGVDTLRHKLRELLASQTEDSGNPWLWRPSAELADALDRVVQSIDDISGLESERRKRAFALWCLVSLRERDDFSGIPKAVRKAALAAQRQLHDRGLDLDLEVAQARYRHIDAQIDRFLHKAPPHANEVTAKIDAVLTHPVAGMAIFIAVMSVVFTAMFDWVAPIMDVIDTGFALAASWVIATVPFGLLGDLLGNGVIKGVGSVVVFLPQIVVLFFFLTLLEGCGYMSRAAFMMDRVMRKIGLQGKAFVPLVSGYACAIPAVLATRTLESHRDRLLTMMVIPLVSCSARLPVYTLIIGALFPAERKVLGPLSLGTLMMLALYLLSMVLALIAAAVLGRVLLKGKRHALLIELPPYRLPHARTVALVLWHKARIFLRTAGTVIVAVSLILWTLLALPQEVDYSRDYDRAIAAARSHGDGVQARQLQETRQAEKLHQSYAGRLGRLIEPLLAPLGFDWKIGIGLIGSIAAREVFVATMGLVYGVGDNADEKTVSLREAIRGERRADGSMVYTPLTGLSLLVFFLFAMQCMSTLAVVRQESGSWRWSLLMLAYLTGLAYAASLLVYQGGKLLGY